MNKIDLILYINLKHRTDRMLRMDKMLKDYNLYNERFGAIKHTNGHIGCGKSHIECLKIANERNLDNVLIMEDDFMFSVPKETLEQRFEDFFKNVKNWDVMLLSGVGNLTPSKNYTRAENIQTASAYLVNKHYIPVLIYNFEQAVKNLEMGLNPNENAIDQYWKNLQKKDNWYIFNPIIGLQEASYSDIERKYVNYDSAFLKPFTVFLKGGLGNQLFQIAFGYGLQKKYNLKFNLCRASVNPHSKLDYTWFRREIPVNVFFRPTSIIVEPENACLSFIQEEMMKNFHPDVEFHGYFQNEKYFNEYKEDIIEMFTPNVDEKLFTQKYPLLNSSFFVHIRRGDYLNSPLHNIDLTNYYKKLIDKEEHYYVFSDDIPWCKQNFPLKNLTFVDEDEINSLWLMSKCWKGGICANSSFSWWGSYLNINKDKKVYFPSKWFNNSWPVDVYPKGSVVVEV